MTAPRWTPRSSTPRPFPTAPWGPSRDRKSTRLNSSHMSISYAVFCLKKKKKCTVHHRVVARFDQIVGQESLQTGERSWAVHPDPIGIVRHQHRDMTTPVQPRATQLNM